MKKLITLLFCAVSLWVSATNTADTTKSIFEKGLDQIKLQKARHLFMTYDFNGALEIYEDLQAINKGNALVNFRLGEVHFELRNYETALNYLEKAYRIAPDVNRDISLVYGKAAHRLGELDKAIEHYTKFKGLLKEKQIIELEDIDRLIKQAELAKKLIATPAKAKLENLGNAINTKYADYGPSISGDGKTLIFTSRRADTKGGGKDINDHIFYEDIYISTWDDETSSWNMSEPVPGRLNSEFHDACLNISPDGQSIYVYKNFGEKGSGEIYVSSLSASGKWGSPKSIGTNVNTSYFESSASVTSDGNTMYFISERKGGFGQSDIWEVKKNEKSDWGIPRNLGKGINTKFDERMVSVHPDGNVIFFSTDGHETMGGYDIFLSRKVNDTTWSKPINLGYPINTVDDDINFVVTSDFKKAYYSGIKSEGLGEKDIYEIDLSNFALLKNEMQGMSMRVMYKGSVADEKGGKQSKAVVELKDKSTSQIIESTTTDKEGNFSLTLTAGNSYSLSIKKSGYKDYSEDFSTEKDKDISKIIKLIK